MGGLTNGKNGGGGGGDLSINNIIIIHNKTNTSKFWHCIGIEKGSGLRFVDGRI